MQKYIILLFLLAAFNNNAKSQVDLSGGGITGNFKIDAQTYTPDASIGADTVNEKMLSNSYMNVVYHNGKFTAGLRFEGYLNTMLGYDKGYDGFGLATRYATYNAEFIEITAGSFYEQFGNGLVFRSYEDKDLGYDNAMDGARIKVKPANGIILTGIIGKQRIYWETGQGIVRGLDADFSINEFIPVIAESKNRFIFGASFVSKYQADEDPLLKLPENVAAGSGRIGFSRGGFNLNTEYAYKSQDPGSDNNSIYKTGSALLINSNFSQKGFGIMLQYKWIDNMSFRSDRNAKLNNLAINYLPSISKNHTYTYAAMYPYASQLNGESGFQSEVFYNFKKESFLGGAYGTMFSANYSRVNTIKQNSINNATAIGEWGTDGYYTNFLSASDSLFSQDFNVEITRKFSKTIKGIFTYQHIDYNIAALQGHGFEHGGMVNANTLIADVTWKIMRHHTIRFESQLLLTKTVNFTTPELNNVKIKQDYGNWAMLLIEYSINPGWFFAMSDQFNYVSNDKEIARNTFNYVHNGKALAQIHYYNLAMGYTKGASRIQIGYGKQREGILCVGGVCRSVPAAYGFNISISSTF